MTVDTSGWVVDVPVGYRVGPYRVDGGIAAGSWGCVYGGSLVSPTGELPRQAALKFLPTGQLTPAQRGLVHELADREARFGSSVAADRLIRVYRVFGVHDPSRPDLDGSSVVVMERAECSLRDRLDAEDAVIADAGASALLADLARALSDLHAQGWVHADIKPENLLVMPDGSLKLADFGLTAELEGTHAYVPNLASSDYVPPEWWTQHMGVRGMPIRPSSDIWAFGVVAHVLLTGGQHPFPGATSRVRAAAVREAQAAGEEARVNPRLAAPWRELVLDCLTMDPVERARRTQGLASRVRDLRDVPPFADAASWPAGTGTRASRRRWTRPVLAGAAAVALLGVAGGGWLLTRPDSGADGPSQVDTELASEAGSSAGQPGTGEQSGSGGPPAANREPASDPDDDPLPEVDEGLPAGEIRADAPVPDQYRQIITDTAHSCPDAAVTPALIAAMLSAESGFDPNKRSPETDEYGIAMWSPWLFEHWAVPGPEEPSVFDPEDSILAMGSYICASGETLRQNGVDDTDPEIRAAVFRVGTDDVIAADGAPREIADYITEVEVKRKAFGTE